MDLYGSGRKSGDVSHLASVCPYVEGDKIEVLFRDHWHSGEFVCENAWGGLDVRYDDAKWDIARVSPKSVRQPEALKKTKKSRKESRMEIAIEKKMSVATGPSTPLAMSVALNSHKGSGVALIAASSSTAVSQIASSASLPGKMTPQEATLSQGTTKSPVGPGPPMPSTPSVIPASVFAPEPVPIKGSLSLTEETVLKKRRSIVMDEAEENIVMSLRIKTNTSSNAGKSSRTCVIL